MDVDDEWELLPDEGFLEINDDGGKQIYSRKSAAAVFQMNYFICPPPTPEFVETTVLHRPLPVPIDLPPPTLNRDRDREQPVQIKIESLGTDQDPISLVFFKKMKEAEFVDMKVDSPKPSVILPQLANFQFEEEKGGEFDAEMNEKEGGGGAGECVWKRGLSGIGAICSFGVAAATFCIIVFTNKHPHHNHNLHFRIYSDDKRMKVKETIAAVSGVPITRARITVGGYYDASPSL